MPPEASLALEPRAPLLSRLAPAWRRPLAGLALVWLAVALLTARDWIAMARLWWDVSTYNHILFVPVIVAWLVWQRRGELAKLEPRAWWPALVPFAGALAAWLIARLGGLDIGSQLAAVVALQMALVALLGPRIAAALLFPLAYSLFLVPFGEELVPALQMLTAKMTIALTLWSGVPAVVDGVFIDTPAGLFEVAEECSGVKFLIAMIALGVLVAQCCFRSWSRRALFMAVAVILPILANGVRAWGTIYIAQIHGVEFAVGFDHIVYGWVFFGVVIAILLAVSWRWFDRDPEEVQIDAGAIAASVPLGRIERLGGPARLLLPAALALTALAALWHSAAIGSRAELPGQVETPAVAGWEPVRPAHQVPWSPRAGGADLRLLASYRDAGGAQVDLFLAVYAAQGQGADATGFGEGALPPDSEWRWLAPAQAPSGMAGDALFARGSVKRIAWSQWRTGALSTASPARLKLAVMRDRALLASRPVTTLILSAEGTDEREIAARLGRFLAAMGPTPARMDHAAGLR
mgnify:CR=1 FL=1